MSNDESDKESEAIDNVKALLNIKQSDKTDKAKTEKFLYDKKDYQIEENAKNITSKDKVEFNDVMKMFIPSNETQKANISKTMATYMKNKEKNKVEIKFNDKEDKIIERTKAYKEITKDVSKYQDKVKANREADIVDFTQMDNKTNKSITKKTAKEFASKFTEQNDFEKSIKNILVKNNCESDDKILQKENEELMKISPEEMQKRYNEIKRYKALLFQKEISNRRKAKIKSKLFHKINKRRKEKEEMKVLQDLSQIDPEAVKNYLEKKKENRIEERMNLKHSINSKFQKTVKRFNLQNDQQIKEAIKENFALRDKLLQKVKGEDEDDEDNEEEFEELESQEEEKEEQDDGVVVDFEEKEKDQEEEDNNEIKDSGVFSMKFMKNAENSELQPKLKMLNDDIKIDEEFVEEEDDKDSDSEEKKKKSKPNKAKQITSSDLAKISNDAKNLLTNQDDKNVKINLNAEDLRKILNEENIEQDIAQFNQFLVENDTNKAEFLESENKAQIEKIKKENPDFIPGWGSWTGDSTQLKAKEFLQKKRYEAKIQRLHQQANENVEKNTFVKVNNSFDKNFSSYLVKELPLNMANREQFELLNNNPIGREWNSLTTYKQIIQPKIVKKIGQIIEPMSINDKTKAKKLTENLEFFRKENGKYLKYPQIQPYLKLSENSGYNLFILYNHKMFELEKIDGNYHIKREIEDINPSLYMDDVFYDKKNLSQPRIQDEEILIIKE